MPLLPFLPASQTMGANSLSFPPTKARSPRAELCGTGHSGPLVQERMDGKNTGQGVAPASGGAASSQLNTGKNPRMGNLYVVFSFFMWINYLSFFVFSLHPREAKLLQKTSAVLHHTEWSPGEQRGPRSKFAFDLGVDEGVAPTHRGGIQKRAYDSHN